MRPPRRRRGESFDRAEMDQVLGSGSSSTIDPAVLEEIAAKSIGP